MKTELIKVDTSGEKPLVSARELHDELGVATKYSDWFSRISEKYSFKENYDFYSKLSKTAGRPKTEHFLTVDCAKNVCMVAETEKAQEIRNYFIEVEEEWNKPEKLLSRALVYAKSQLDKIKPKAEFAENVLKCGDVVTLTSIAKEYGKSANDFNKMLQKFGIQYKLGGSWVLRQQYCGNHYTETETTISFDQKVETITHWTWDGYLFLYEFLKKKGILPEKEKIKSCKQIEKEPDSVQMSLF